MEPELTGCTQNSQHSDTPQSQAEGPSSCKIAGNVGRPEVHSLELLVDELLVEAELDPTLDDFRHTSQAGILYIRGLWTHDVGKGIRSAGSSSSLADACVMQDEIKPEPADENFTVCNVQSFIQAIRAMAGQPEEHRMPTRERGRDLRRTHHGTSDGLCLPSESVLTCSVHKLAARTKARVARIA